GGIRSISPAAPPFSILRSVSFAATTLPQSIHHRLGSVGAQAEVGGINADPCEEIQEGGWFDRRTIGNAEVQPAACHGALSVSLWRIQRDGKRRAATLVPDPRVCWHPVLARKDENLDR